MSADRDLAGRVEPAVLARGGQRRGDEITFCCPQHAEDYPTAKYNTAKQVWFCHTCSAKGGLKELAQNLGIETAMTKPPTTRKRETSAARIVATYDYTDETGTLLYQAVRLEPKNFRQRRPDGNGGWISNMDGVRLVLYRLPELLAADPAQTVFVCEGEKDVDRLRAAGLIATTNPMGALKWRPEYTPFFAGWHVVILADNDEPGRKHAAAVAAELFPVSASVRIVELPGLPEKGDVSDWLDAGHTVDDVRRVAAAVEPMRRLNITDVVAAFRSRLYLPDAGHLHVLLAIVVASRWDGDAVWIQFVAPSGGGKTEALNALVGLPNVFTVSTITEAGFLSGTAQRDRKPGADGGLLRKIGAFGLLIVKDFTSLLSMPHDRRAQTIAALREIFDGRWERRIGNDGGQALTWEGKLVILAGVTDAIDQHHAVIGVLGERFLFYRLPPADGTQQAHKAIANAWTSKKIRDELAAVVAQLFASLGQPEPPAIEPATHTRLSHLAALAARCRTPVIRDAHRREIELIPNAEMPGRLAVGLVRLFAGMIALGTDHDLAFELVEKVAFDSMPALRRKIFNLLAAQPAADAMETPEIGRRVGYPTPTTKRVLEDFVAHDVVERLTAEKGDAHRWRLSTWTRARLAAVAGRSENSATAPDHDGNGGRSENSSTPHTPTPLPTLFKNTKYSYDDFTDRPPVDPPADPEVYEV